MGQGAGERALHHCDDRHTHSSDRVVVWNRTVSLLDAASGRAHQLDHRADQAGIASSGAV